MSNNLSINNPKLARAVATSQKEEAQRTDSLVTLRDRLTRRAKQNAVIIELKDSDGSFHIRCRLFTEAEQRKMLQYQDIAQRIKGKPDEYGKAMATLYEILAYPNGVCLDPELDKTYWESFEYSSDLPILIVSRITEKTQQIIRDANLFRPE